MSDHRDDVPDPAPAGRQPPTLSMQIGIYAGVALLVFSLLLASLMILGMKRILEDSLLDKASMLAKQIATVSLDAVLMHDYGVLERYTADLSGSDGLVYLRIRREDGTVLAEDGTAVSSQPRLQLQKPILLADRTIGDVTVAYERSDIDRAITHFTLLVILAVALLSALFFFSLRSLLKRRLINPIERLAHELHPLLPESEPFQLNAASPREVHELRHTFQQLRGEISQHISEIEQANHLARAATQRLCQSQRLASIGQMAAGLAHSLNTPLGNILGYAQQARRKATDEDMRGRIDVIERQAQACSDIVRNLLSAARRPDIHIQPFDLAVLARATVKLLRPVVRDHGVELQLDTENIPTSLNTLGDVGAVEQILFNLINNAVQAGATSIHIYLHSEHPWAQLNVEDNGQGIPLELQSRIFEPLFTTKVAGQGTGLGLHLCQTLASNMQGKIQLLDSRPGSTRFQLDLPLADSGASCTTDY